MRTKEVPDSKRAGLREESKICFQGLARHSRQELEGVLYTYHVRVYSYHPDKEGVEDLLQLSNLKTDNTEIQHLLATIQEQCEQFCYCSYIHIWWYFVSGVCSMQLRIQLFSLCAGKGE